MCIQIKILGLVKIFLAFKNHSYINILNSIISLFFSLGLITKISLSVDGESSTFILMLYLWALQRKDMWCKLRITEHFPCFFLRTFIIWRVSELAKLIQGDVSVYVCMSNFCLAEYRKSVYSLDISCMF